MNWFCEYHGEKIEYIGVEDCKECIELGWECISCPFRIPCAATGGDFATVQDSESVILFDGQITAISKNMKKIYISGKITGDPDYKTKFDFAAHALDIAGFAALNPAQLPANMNPADYMRINFAMIDSADAVVFLSDWTNSPGAQLERAYCEYIKKPIIDSKKTEGK